MSKAAPYTVTQTVRAQQQGKTAGRDMTQSMPAKTEDSPASHSSHLSCPNCNRQQSELMMTCQITVMTSDSHVTRERALLNYASFTSFFTKRLAQWLQLPCQYKCVRVAGIGGPEQTLSLRSVVTLTVANEKLVKVGRLSGPRWKVEASVVPKVSTKLPSSPISFDTN